MNKALEENAKRYVEIKDLYKIVDKLEQRIATLEKVLASHAKCIGEMREEKK
jgi:exonuclease VII small subunit